MTVYSTGSPGIEATLLAALLILGIIWYGNRIGLFKIIEKRENNQDV